MKKVGKETRKKATDLTHLKAADIQADLQAVLASLTGGQPVEPQTAQRIRERAQKITQEIRQKHGILSVAIDLIRETRDEA